MQNNRFGPDESEIVRASVTASALPLEFFDAMPLIGLDLAEYRASPVEDEMSYGHDERGFGVRSADIQMARNPSFVSHVEDFCHHAPVWNRRLRRLFRKSSFEVRRQPGFQWK